jgi:hypothetical protein
VVNVVEPFKEERFRVAMGPLLNFTSNSPHDDCTLMQLNKNIFVKNGINQVVEQRIIQRVVVVGTTFETVAIRKVTFFPLYPMTNGALKRKQEMEA